MTTAGGNNTGADNYGTGLGKVKLSAKHTRQGVNKIKQEVTERQRLTQREGTTRHNTITQSLKHHAKDIQLDD